MRYMPLLLSAAMLLGLSGPALAGWDYDDYKDMVHDRNEAYRKAVKRQNKYYREAYKHGYGVRTLPGYYGSYYSQPYYGNHYYNNGYGYGYNRGGGLVGGILRAIF